MRRSNSKCDCGHVSSNPHRCDGCNETFCESCWMDHIDRTLIDNNGVPIEIELHDAFVWDCENCGRENIYRCIRTTTSGNLSAEQEQLIREDYNLEAWESITDHVPKTLLTVPYEVTCKYCNVTFSSSPIVDDVPEGPDDNIEV